MSFKATRKKVLDCLNGGLIQHEDREDIDVKNLLETGQVTTVDVSNIIGRSSGNEYSHSPHHLDSSIDVHIIKTRHSGKNWYVKWYFVDPDTVFISVHN
jgi:hypothetical protein